MISMYLLSKSDVGKKFSIKDENITVTLVDVSDPSYVEVEFASGLRRKVHSSRLTEAKPTLLEEILEQIIQPDRYEKMIKVEVTTESLDGVITTKVLRGMEAEKWNNYQRELCIKADRSNELPKFNELGWEVYKAFKKKRSA